MKDFLRSPKIFPNNIEAENPTTNPQIPQNTPFTRTFPKVRANFWLLPCDMSQVPCGNCSEKLVRMIFFGGGGLRVFLHVDSNSSSSDHILDGCTIRTETITNEKTWRFDFTFAFKQWNAKYIPTDLFFPCSLS